VIGISCVVAVHTVHAQNNVSGKPLTVICLPERPVIVEGGRTSLQAWAITPNGEPLPQPLTFEWQMTAGVSQGTGAEVQWDLSSVRIDPNGMHQQVAATVKAVSPSMAVATCTITVFIERRNAEEATRSTRGGLISARRYLLPGQREEPGYGLYSYLLFSGPPQSGEEKARYLKTLESCLALIQDIEEYQKRHVRPSQLNISHIPVTKSPKEDPAAAQWAENVLAVYDYATAQILLNKLNKTYQQGPYLMSVQTPLTDAPTPVSLHLLQNFTGVVPDLAARGVKLFEYLCAQQRSWTDEALRTFTFTLRNLIAVAGQETPKVASGFKTAIQLIKAAE
jgi:hypothetical protein